MKSEDFEKKLGDLKPNDVFSFFEEICAVPHPSGYKEKMCEYLESFAEERSLDYKKDEYGNIVIYKPASEGSESEVPVILQAHYDMVPGSEDYVNFDFKTDSIETFIEGDYIKTCGTTLGADDGIGVSMILAVLNDDTLTHPPIEALFTADEEIGMLGAINLDSSLIKGKRLINLDSEEDGVLICGCAGGADVHCSIPLKREDRTGITLEIKIQGLTGGHSGLEINKGRANAAILMTRLLLALEKELDFGLSAFVSGTKETAIPALSAVKISVYPTVIEEVKRIVKRYEDIFKNEFSGIEDYLGISLTQGDFGTESVLTLNSLHSVLRCLALIPNGVFDKIPYLPSVVQSSSNLGIVNVSKNNLFFTCCVRSSVKSVLEWNVQKISSVLQLFGGSAYTDSSYPEWTYKTDTPLQEIAKKAYNSLFVKEICVSAIHAGMECGVFSEKMESLDAISMGPTMYGVHTPFERLSISSTERTYDFLKKILSLL